MPTGRSTHQSLGFDCDFTSACRWSSVGMTPDRWRLGRGEPDVLLWLAATGTMVVPGIFIANSLCLKIFYVSIKLFINIIVLVEPFTLLEVRGGTAPDMLCSDIIGCQQESSLFSFTFWTVGKNNIL